ncbi:MAG: RecQ family ATP-dependent DNA helicase [Anaerolineae bacterium]|nr:RecQ family ATP-dependent DNA helicase [Anaerolineae bacterium]
MSDTAILTQLGLTPEQVPELRSNDRSRVLNFLLRWEYLDELHACLDIIIPRKKPLLSLLDLRIHALLAEGKPQAALTVMKDRLETQTRTSITSQSLFARVQLALGNVELAQRIARKTLEDNPDSPMSWSLLGEMELAAGNQETALAAYRHLQAQYPHSRPYLSGMVNVYRAQEDWVTATAYAVRLLRTAEEQEGQLSIQQLRHLLNYFYASGDATRAADLEAALAQRHAEELSTLQAHIAELTGRIAIQTVSQAPATIPTPPTEFLPTFDQVPVSEAERAIIIDALQKLFGFTRLLPGQTETIACALRNEDALTILPTGGGKSLCYQIPAFLATEGITLVISPLIALMKDQVDSLPDLIRSRATTINSTLENDELRYRLEQVAAGGYRMVYAAPERLRQAPFLYLLRQAKINRLVIDEAHCVSVWGHDFRPDYLFISQAREILGHPPLLALTATAPPRVRRDILQRLGEMHVIAGDVTRPNLRLSVFYARNADDKLQHLLAFCKSQTGSGIIYAGTRARCEQIAALLRQMGLDAVHYHAGISNRAAVQDAFMNNHTRIVVATVAFGMGIDKPDIRFIVHFVPPPSLEAYYQEAGRAGRDGQPAECLLMYASSDRGTLTRRAHENIIPVEFLRKVYAMVKRRLNSQTVGQIAAADLERDLGTDETQVRVALSLLEETELLRRGMDLPRSALITVNQAARNPANAPDFARFCRSARLKPGQPLTVNLIETAQAAQIPLEHTESAGLPDEAEPLEFRLLAWADAGWITYSPSGRDLALSLPTPPTDAAERVATLLERHTTIQEQRVDEIAAYAQTGRCRHGYLNAYLGGRTIEHCEACDNCVSTAALPDADLPDTRAQLLTILRVLANVAGWGRATLTSILRGEADAPGQHDAEFGALAFRSNTAVGKLITLLEEGNFIAPQTLSHGGVSLQITPAGRAAMKDPTCLDAYLPKKRTDRRTQATTARPQQHTLTGEVITESEVDKTLYEKLRAWRLELAQAQKVPAYVICSNDALKDIATLQPTTLEALETIKGIGSKKLEQYGEKILELVQVHKADVKRDI